MCRSHQLHGSYCCGYSDLTEAGVGQPVLMQKIYLNVRTMKDLLRTCHLNTEISAMTGPLETSLKNVLENLKYIGVRLQRASNATKRSSDYSMGSWEPTVWKIFKKEVTG